MVSRGHGPSGLDCRRWGLSDEVRIYIGDQYYCTMPRDEFERQYAEAAPVRETIRRELAAVFAL